MLQYALLHLCGYAVSMDDLKHFRVSTTFQFLVYPSSDFVVQSLDSKTPGHPEPHATPGVEVSDRFEATISFIPTLCLVAADACIYLHF